MSKKTIISIFAGIGLTIGGCIPLLWGGDPLGGWSILLGFVGGIVGIVIGVKVGNAIG